MFKIYCDGSCKGNGKENAVGAFAYVVLNEKDEELFHFTTAVPQTTNNQMELGAVIIALRLIKEPCNSILIYTDSQYVIGCATLGWKRKKNVKLWLEYDRQIQRVSELCSNIKFSHVKGHNSDYWNNYCDKIAVKASQLI